VDFMQRISEAEMNVMEVIWNHKQPMTSNEIMSFLQNKQWKLTTVLTLLSRLTAKGFLKSQRKGRFNLYSSIISKDDYKIISSKNFLNEFYQSSIKNFFAALYSQGEISQDDLEQLKAFLDGEEKDK